MALSRDEHYNNECFDESIKHINISCYMFEIMRNNFLRYKLTDYLVPNPRLEYFTGSKVAYMPVIKLPIQFGVYNKIVNIDMKET